MTEIRRGTCHCGAVEFQVELQDGLQDLRRCNCSLCRRKGAVMASVPLDKLTIIRGADQLSLYQWRFESFAAVIGEIRAGNSPPIFPMLRHPQ